MADLMKDSITFTKLTKMYGNFMVPLMKVKISGIDIVSTYKAKINNMDVSLALDESGSASFRISDVFDLESRKFKFNVNSIFKLGNIVTVELGYGSLTKKVFHGFVSEVTYEYNDSPQINVVAMDIIKLMMINKRANYKYESKNYSDILKAVISKYGKGYKKLNIDVTRDSLKNVTQNSTDYSFIKDVICKQTNKEFMLVAGDIYFRKPKAVTKPITTIEWGKSLISFTERQKYCNEKYVVIGQDDDKKKKVEASAIASTDSSRSMLLNSPIIIEDTDGKVEDLDHAKAKAESLARERLKSCKSGNGTVIGLPEIVPGRFIKITNIGCTNSNYYISSVRHSFGEDGFTTEFEIAGW